MNTGMSCSLAAFIRRSMFSTVLLALTLSPTTPHEAVVHVAQIDRAREADAALDAPVATRPEEDVPGALQRDGARHVSGRRRPVAQDGSTGRATPRDDGPVGEVEERRAGRDKTTISKRLDVGERTGG